MWLQVSQHNLVHHGDWYSCQFDILETAFVLDFVFSDTAKRSWDNNAQQVIKLLAAAAIKHAVPSCSVVLQVMHSTAVGFLLILLCTT